MEELTTESIVPEESDDSVRFVWADYLVLVIVLAVSVGIGVYYAFFGNKNQTNEEYLIGGRQMRPLPVALSLLCSYVSSITLLGHPSEIYYFGTQLSMVLLCYIPLTLSLIYVFTPIYFNLQFISIYEYLEWRFNRPLRLFVSIINLIYGILLMSLVVYGPAISLQLVTGIDWQYLVAVMFIVCIFYSSMGGFRAVLLTDSIQAILMIVSIAVVTIVGTSKAGGISAVWKKLTDHERDIFFNFDFDPRTRHTFWTAVVGGYFQWLPMYANQAQIQRYISLPNMRAVKQALLINLLGLFLLMGFLYFAGIIIFATYSECDPWIAKRIQSPNQILPLFVMDTLNEYPGLAGLFVAGITCAALSTVSSAINALAANCAEDYIKAWKPEWGKSSYASKIVSIIMGFLAFGAAFIVAEIGSIFSAASAFLGVLGGPTFVSATTIFIIIITTIMIGAFVCGMFFPWATSEGTIAGMGLAFVIMSVIGGGSTYYTNEEKLPYQGYVGCNVTLPYWKDRDDSAWIQFMSISPLWFPALGNVLSIIFGVSLSFLCSKFWKKNFVRKIESRLIIPIMLKLWITICPEQCKKLIVFTAEELLAHPELAVSEFKISGIDTEKKGYDNPTLELDTHKEK